MVLSRLGAVEACWAHNPKVPGSKPGVAKGEGVFFFDTKKFKFKYYKFKFKY